MHRARPEELQTEAVPALTARLSESALAKLFPVKMEEMDSWDEPEPSKGALIQLESGHYLVVIYGKETQTTEILVPEGTNVTTGIEALLAEVPLSPKSILWRRDAARGTAAPKPRRLRALSPPRDRFRGTAHSLRSSRASKRSAARRKR